MSNPYREPGMRPGRLIHQSVRFFVTKQEWDDLQAALAQDGYQSGDESEWAYQTILKVLRERKD